MQDYLNALYESVRNGGIGPEFPNFPQDFISVFPAFYRMVWSMAETIICAPTLHKHQIFAWWPSRELLTLEEVHLPHKQLPSVVPRITEEESEDSMVFFSFFYLFAYFFVFL